MINEVFPSFFGFFPKIYDKILSRIKYYMYIRDRFWHHAQSAIHYLI